MDIKKVAPYAGAILALVLAIVGLMSALHSSDGSAASWDSIIASTGQMEAASKLTEVTAVQNKDYKVCIVSKSTTGLIHGVSESLSSAKAGTCRIPDVSVDVTDCIALKPVPVAPPVAVAPVVAPAAPPVAPVVAPVSAPAATPVVAPVAVAAPVVAPVAVAAPVVDDVTPIVTAAVGPLTILVQGAISKADVDPKVTAWGTGALAWIASGIPSIVALVNDPKDGKLSFTGQDIAGCKP